MEPLFGFVHCQLGRAAVGGGEVGVGVMSHFTTVKGSLSPMVRARQLKSGM